MLVPIDRDTGTKKKNLTAAEAKDQKDRLEQKKRQDEARKKK